MARLNKILLHLVIVAPWRFLLFLSVSGYFSLAFCLPLKPYGKSRAHFLDWKRWLYFLEIAIVLRCIKVFTLFWTRPEWSKLPPHMARCVVLCGSLNNFAQFKSYRSQPEATFYNKAWRAYMRESGVAIASGNFQTFKTDSKW